MDLALFRGILSLLLCCFYPLSRHFRNQRHLSIKYTFRRLVRNKDFRRHCRVFVHSGDRLWRIAKFNLWTPGVMHILFITFICLEDFLPDIFCLSNKVNRPYISSSRGILRPKRLILKAINMLTFFRWSSKFFTTISLPSLIQIMSITANLLLNFILIDALPADDLLHMAKHRNFYKQIL